MPWSWAAGMKCVLMIPFVVHPQTKNVPASSQKVRDLMPTSRPSMASRAAAQPLWVAFCSCSSAV